jgi:hypothetical protein
MTHTAQPAENADEPAQMRIAHTHWTNGQLGRLVAEYLGGDGEVRTAMQTVCMKWSTGADGRHRRRTTPLMAAISGLLKSSNASGILCTRSVSSSLRAMGVALSPAARRPRSIPEQINT